MQKIENEYQKKLKQEKIASREKAKEVADNTESQSLPKVRKGKQQIEDEKRALLGEIEALKSVKTTLENEIEKARIELKTLRENINNCQFENWQKSKNLDKLSDILLQLCFEVDGVKEAPLQQAKDFEIDLYKKIIAAKKIRGLDYSPQETHLNNLLA